MLITEAMIRPLKERGLSDIEVGARFGVSGGKIKNLRFKYGIPSLRPDVATRARADLDGWPAVMNEKQRERHWARYFRKLGRDHSADDVVIPRTGRILANPSTSHLVGGGASALSLF